jgi:hypothetical protein
VDRRGSTTANSAEIRKHGLPYVGSTSRRRTSFPLSFCLGASFSRVQRADELLTSMMPNLSVAVPHVRPYLLTSFGSFMRMDYGTGHETSFGFFLLCLTLVRFLRFDPEEARHIVLTVFVRYLRLCWRLQDVYRLEPAGSHGVWGLDDSHFLGYIFGSAQLRGMAVYRWNSIPLTLQCMVCRPE